MSSPSSVPILLSFRNVDVEGSKSLSDRLEQLGLHTVVKVSGDSAASDQITYSQLSKHFDVEHWSQVQISSEGLMAFTEYERSHEFLKLRQDLLVIQNRRDFSGTFRILEREIEIRTLLLVLFSCLLSKRPQLAVFDVTPHDFVSVGLEGALRWLGIHILFFQPSLVGPQSLPRTSLTSTFSYSISNRIHAEYSSELAETTQLAVESIERLESGKGTKKLETQFKKEHSAKSLRGKLRAVGQFAIRLLNGLPFRSIGLTGHVFLPSWFARSLEVVLEWSLRRSLNSAIHALQVEVPEMGGKFAIFALHYEPERCSIPEGHPYTSQIDAVLRARAILPDDIVLIVKEHFSQSAAALRGILGRSPGVYSMLEGIPGVKMLGIKANTPQLITRAECVFTLTGKIGIEAALKGTPVIFGGQPWWDAMPGSASMTQFNESADLTEFLLRKTPSRDDVFTWLHDKFQNELVPILGDKTVERYTERISALPERFSLLQLEVLVDLIEQFVKSVVTTKTREPGSSEVLF